MKGLNFPKLTDEVFTEKFLSIVAHGTKSGPFKFAFAKFLVEYCNEPTVQNHVEISTISRYFLRFFWPQVCKTKLKHSPRYSKKGGVKEPNIITIIQNEFTESWYPKYYPHYEKNEKLKIQACVDEITEKCFNDVVWRFQKINDVENKTFFDYKVKKGWKGRNKKKTDLSYGINVNPYFIKYVKRRYGLLNTLVIHEWAKFLEKYNHGVPLIIQKLSGEKIKRKGTTKEKEALAEHYHNCFYCGNKLQPGKQTHLEHVIPFDYIAEDNIWNFSLACQKCNCKKSGALPTEDKLDELIANITKDRNKKHMEKLDDSLKELGDDFADVIRNHYRNAKKVGYAEIIMP